MIRLASAFSVPVPLVAPLYWELPDWFGPGRPLVLYPGHHRAFEAAAVALGDERGLALLDEMAPVYPPVEAEPTEPVFVLGDDVWALVGAPTTPVGCSVPPCVAGFP